MAATVSTENGNMFQCSWRHSVTMGKIRSGNVQASSFNSTGQRRDDTGLLYDNARYYDPSRGQFVSSDSMVADLSNPATLNRYAYAFNNPLRYTDPSGHCNVDGTDGDDPAACADQVDQLGAYGVTVGYYAVGLWSLLELTTMLDALKRFANAFGWDTAQFRAQIGDVLVHQVRTDTTKSLLGQNPAAAWPHPAEGRTHILFAQDAMYDSAGNFNAAFFTSTVIHEFAHAWDFNTNSRNSVSLMRLTGARVRAGDSSVKMTSYGRTNRWEAWAEAVTSTVLQTNEVDEGTKQHVHDIADGCTRTCNPYVGSAWK